MTYYVDYPKKPMGKPNPYYGCAYCGISDPQINGDLYKHDETCEYRIIKELELEIEELKGDLINYDYDSGKESINDYYIATLFNEILERLEALEKHVTLQ